MKIVAVVLVATALWVVLSAVLGGCSGRHTAGHRSGPAAETWVWESLDRHAVLTRGAGLPPSHPLARLRL